MTASALSPFWKPNDELYTELADLPHLMKIAWLDALADPEHAEQIIADAAGVAKRLAQLASLYLKGASERAARRENAVDRATEAAERRIAFALDDIASGGGQYLDPNGYYVYLLREAAGLPPIYVGQSANIFARLGDHMRAPDRRHRVKHIEVLRCKNRRQMDLTEMRLIRHFKPELNTMGI